ncbi:MAG: threonine synthase [Anaerolineales bacterium]|nr:threonine synthase [Anaerolineales bacterium]MCB9128355.1 threonine synthase [Ardenticatenales bacterium]MCB9172167.1 threonine synthase [Ardenticatenales bacterium]
MTDYTTDYRCLICGETYDFDEVAYVCPKHGAVGTLDVRYDYAAMGNGVKRDEIRRSEWPSMWRYLPLLPVADPALIPPLDIGWTPLYHAERLATATGFDDLWLKDDSRNPTGSLKDRASAMAVVRARAMGYETIATASTGNAAAALAGVAASVGMRHVIFVPRTAPEAKIAQLLVYGAEVNLVDGSYDQAFELCLSACEQEGWYCRNTGYNPWMTEGKKTVAYEIAEQLGWEAPDAVVVSVGDGCIIGGVHKGFYDLLQLGWITRMPRLYGVQAAGSDACTLAWEQGRHADLPRIAAQTRADSISADLPRDGFKALRAVRESNGAFLRVSDEAILAAIPELARQSGVFAEPAAAAAWAGARLALAQGRVARDERVVVLITGSGLKDVAAARASVDEKIEYDHSQMRKGKDDRSTD